MTGYEPLNTLKPVADGLWMVDGPAVIRGRVPLPSRAVVARLQNGDVWVHAPTALTEGLRTEVEALGPVTHLVVPNWHHSGHVADWHVAFPQAQIWAVPAEGHYGPGLEFDHALGTGTPWQTDISHIVVGGSRRYREAVFFHRASQTLIISDLIQNIETVHLPVWARPLVWFAGTDDSGGKMPYFMRRSYGKSPQLAEAIEHVLAWRPRGMIVTHGRCYERGAIAELERAYKKLLHERQWSRAMDEVDRTGDK